MRDCPFSIGTVVLGGGAALLTLFLVIGFLLPTDWTAERSALLDEPAAEIFALLDSPEGWREWTQWPDSGLVRAGPERGAGASISWDDSEFGSGTFTIVEAVPDKWVRYEVVVRGGSIRTSGTVTLTPQDDGTRVAWQEDGDLGWNPLMGYWALSMSRAQGAELEKGLERLGAATGSVPSR